jgi:hypothetical protein
LTGIIGLSFVEIETGKHGRVHQQLSDNYFLLEFDCFEYDENAHIDKYRHFEVKDITYLEHCCKLFDLYDFQFNVWSEIMLKRGLWKAGND